MTPHPPYLPPGIHEWDAEELFYIVEHGVKFTGMPAWPAQQRDDEVWAMVAFLQELPELNEQDYQRLAGAGGMMTDDAPLHALAGAEAVPGVITNSCGRCHGMNGQGGNAGAFPKLAGQRPAYLKAALLAYAQGRRPSGFMEPIAAGLSRDEISEVVGFYSSLTAPRASSSSPTSDTAVSRGAEIAREGVLHERIPICAECHGPGDHSRNPVYPTLAGQSAAYLVLQLELFAKDHRGGSEYARIMHAVAGRLTPQQMRDVSQYYESLTLPAVEPTP